MDVYRNKMHLPTSISPTSISGRREYNRRLNFVVTLYKVGSSILERGEYVILPLSQNIRQREYKPSCLGPKKHEVKHQPILAVSTGHLCQLYSSKCDSLSLRQMTQGKLVSAWLHFSYRKLKGKTHDIHIFLFESDL